MRWLDSNRAREKLLERESSAKQDSAGSGKWPLTQKELAKALAEISGDISEDGLDNNLSRLINPILMEVVAKRLVTITPSNKTEYKWGGGIWRKKERAPGFDQDLEDIASEFRWYFSKIGIDTNIVVVDSDNLERISYDNLHSILGDICADEIISRDLLNEKSIRIAWGSGRGVYYTEESIFQKSNDINILDDAKIDIISLAGSLFNGPVYPDQYYLDADDIASRSVRIFRTGTVLIHKVASHLANQPDEVVKILKRCYKGLEFNESINPSLTVFGVGVLDNEHRLRQALSGRSSEIGYEPESLKPAADKLEALFELSDEIESNLHYKPLGVICNRMLVVSPEFGEKRDIYVNKYEDKLKEAATEANRYLVAVRKRNIQNTEYGNNFVVAGGIDKTTALYSLLTGSFTYDENKKFKVPVKVLVTDRFTSVELIRIAREAEERGLRY